MHYLIIKNINNYSSFNYQPRNIADFVVSTLSSYINNTENNYATIINASINDYILDITQYCEYDMLILSVNEDNIKSILRIKDKLKAKPLLLLSVNEQLSGYFSKNENDLYFNYAERKNEEYNLTILGELLKLKTNWNKEIFPYTCVERKCMSINIGSGCDQNCSFCVLSNSTVEYHPVEVIVEEIKEQLDRGIKYFHVSNHSFTSNLEYVRKFCIHLIDKCGNYDFKWSCFIIPGSIIQDLNIISLMKKAKLDRVEIGVENINPSILKDFNIHIETKDIFRIIDFCDAINISSISINYIVGSPKESENTLAESKRFIENLIEKATKRIDINISFFYPDIGTKYATSVNDHDRLALLNKCIKRKESCIYDTKRLCSADIYSWKTNLDKSVYSKRQVNIKNLSSKQRIDICILNQYGISTQYFKHFSMMSIAKIVEKAELKDVYFFLRDIADKTQYYAPKLASDRITIDSSDNIIILPDTIFVDDQTELSINISEFHLYDCILAEMSISEIINSNYSDGIETFFIKERIRGLLEKLEKYHLIYYIRILN